MARHQRDVAGRGPRTRRPYEDSDEDLYAKDVAAEADLPVIPTDTVVRIVRTNAMHAGYDDVRQIEQDAREGRRCSICEDALHQQLHNAAQFFVDSGAGRNLSRGMLDRVVPALGDYDFDGLREADEALDAAGRDPDDLFMQRVSIVLANPANYHVGYDDKGVGTSLISYEPDGAHRLTAKFFGAVPHGGQQRVTLEALKAALDDLGLPQLTVDGMATAECVLEGLRVQRRDWSEGARILNSVVLLDASHPALRLFATEEDEHVICQKINEVLAQAQGRRPTDTPPPQFSPGELDVVWRDDTSGGGFFFAEMTPDQLIAVGEYMRHCVGKPPYPQKARDGRAKYYVMFTEGGRSKFCLEVLMAEGRPVRVAQVKGKANRLPDKPTELAVLARFIEWLGFDPYDRERVKDMGALGERPRKNPSLRIANQYGNVDAARLPAGYAHVPGARVSVTATSLGIDFSPALVGFKKVRGKYKPITNGIVVNEADLPRLEAALARRDARRPTPEQREAKREKAHRQVAQGLAARIEEMFPGMPGPDVRECAEHATEPGSGRVGRVADLDDRHVLMAVVAYARHRYTDYDEMLAEGHGRDDARIAISERLDDTLRGWRRRP